MAARRDVSVGVSGDWECWQGVRDGYADWLQGLSWTTFATLTFKARRTPTRAGVLAHRFLEEQAREGSVDAAVWGAEAHRSGAGHVHALVKVHPWLEPRREERTLEARWRELYGIADFRAYDPAKGAAYYITKYVMKHAYDSGDWDVLASHLIGGGHEGDMALAEGVPVVGGAVRDGDADGSRWRSQAQVEEALDEEDEEEVFWQEVIEEEDGRQGPQQEGSVH